MSDRYSRQTILPEVGIEGQSRLRDARVLVVGAGGLGCAVLQYLGAAGVGTLVIVDHDDVEESNLHRQPIYRMSEVGLSKALAARSALQAINPEIRVESVVDRLTPGNAPTLVSGADLVIDAADNFAVTYVLSDECHRAHTVLVSASVLGLTGYVGSFCGNGPSYRAVFPEMPRRAGSCAESGVLGTAVGVMGTLQAHMALSLLLDLQPTVLSQLVTVDFRTLRFGGFSFAAAEEPADVIIPFIAAPQVANTDVIIDLRSRSEAPTSPFPGALRFDVDTIEETDISVPAGSRIVLCCRTGVRAWRAAHALRARGHENLALVALGV